MSQQTTLKQEEQSNGQHSTEEKAKEIYLNEIIQGGPLRVVGNNDQGYCIVFGKYRVSAIRETEDEARGELVYNNWNVIINLIGAITGEIETTRDKLKS